MVKGSFKRTTFEIVLIPLLACILMCSKEVMAFLPNIELVSFLILLYTRHFGWRTLPIIYIFVLLEGLLYGFGLHFLQYLYIWAVLFFLIKLLGEMDSALAWAIILGCYGLFFGTLCSVPYWFMLGPSGALSWIASGLLWDITHCAGNFVLTLILWKPMNLLFTKAKAVFLK